MYNRFQVFYQWAYMQKLHSLNINKLLRMLPSREELRQPVSVIHHYNRVHNRRRFWIRCQFRKINHECKCSVFFNFIGTSAVYVNYKGLKNGLKQACLTRRKTVEGLKQARFTRILTSLLSIIIHQNCC